MLKAQLNVPSPVSLTITEPTEAVRLWIRPSESTTEPLFVAVCPSSTVTAGWSVVIIGGELVGVAVGGIGVKVAVGGIGVKVNVGVGNGEVWAVAPLGNCKYIVIPTATTNKIAIAIFEPDDFNFISSFWKCDL